MNVKDYGIEKTLERLGILEVNPGVTTGTVWHDTEGPVTESVTPIDGSTIARVKNATKEDYEKVILKAQEAFKEWRLVPAPKRGEVVRQIGLALREYKEDLGRLVTLEMGKIYQEGLGEVQEMIDIADFAVGLSRTIGGPTMPSERPARVICASSPVGQGAISARRAGSVCQAVTLRTKFALARSVVTSVSMDITIPWAISRLRWNYSGEAPTLPV